MREGCLIDGCDRQIYARRLCRSCYESARRLVAAGDVTWSGLIEKGLAAKTRGPRWNPLTVALERLDKKDSDREGEQN